MKNEYSTGNALVGLAFLCGILSAAGADRGDVCFHLRQGDERRRLILLHAGSTSFSAFVGMLLLEIILGVAGSITQGIPIEEKNPLVLLMTAALVYCVSLCYYKRRYGD